VSDTPRTDAEEWQMRPFTMMVVKSEVSRTLERELNAAKADVEAVERMSQASLENIAYKWQMAEGKCDELRAEIERLRAAIKDSNAYLLGKIAKQSARITKLERELEVERLRSARHADECDRLAKRLDTVRAQRDHYYRLLYRPIFLNESADCTKAWQSLGELKETK